MLVIKQNGRSKLGRTGNGIHMETNNNMETPNAVWPTAEQAGWRSVHMSVLILCAPGSPSSFDPLSETPPKGWQRSGERDIESEFMGRCLEPELVPLSQGQSHWGETSLLEGWGPREGWSPQPILQTC